MLRSIGRILLYLATGATIATILLMWASAYSAYIPPHDHGWLDVLGLCFPIFAAGNLIALIGWLIGRSKRMIIPIIGFAGCFGTLRAYCPINIPQSIPKDCIKVMTYNVMNFSLESDNPENSAILINEILSSKSDIVFIQEGQYPRNWNELEKKLRKTFPYIEALNTNESRSVLCCFSRYPIIGKESLHIVSEGNSAGIFLIDIGKGDTLHAINCHLQSDGLTQKERSNYKEFVKGDNRPEVRTTLFSLVKKLSAAAEMRSSQVDSISQYVCNNSASPIIVCGDFNDSPVSYARHKLAAKLTDTYKASGQGPGFTFNSDGMYVRIDHIFCSKHWKPYGATVERSMKNSDHYPVSVFLKRKSK